MLLTSVSGVPNLKRPRVAIGAWLLVYVCLADAQAPANELPELVAQTGHQGLAWEAAWSPDGRFIASGGDDNIVKLWDAATGYEVLSLQGHTDEVFSVAFSADSRWLVSGSWDRSVKVWDLARGRLHRSLEGHTGWVTSVAFSRDGRWLATGSSDGTIRTWQVGSWQPHGTLQQGGSIEGIAFHPDSRQLVASGSRLAVWDVGSGQQLFTLDPSQGRLRRPGETRIYSTGNVAIDAQGSRLAVAVGQTVRVFDLSSRRAIRTFDHQSDVTDVAFDPNRARVVSTGEDGEVRQWELVGDRFSRTRLADDMALSVAFSPDGRRWVASSGDHRIVVFDAGDGHQHLDLSARAEAWGAAILSPDMRWLALHGDGRVPVFDLHRGFLARSFDIESTDAGWSAGRRIAFDPQGRYLARAESQAVIVMDMTTGGVVRRLAPGAGFDGRIASIVFGSAQRIGVAYRSGFGFLPPGSRPPFQMTWDTSSGRAVSMLQRDGRGDSSEIMAFSDDGRWMIAEDPRQYQYGYQVWDLATGRLQRTLGSSVGGWSAALSRHGRWLATTSKNTDTATLDVWETTSGRQTVSTTSSDSGIWVPGTLSFSPDERHVAWVSGFGKVTISDAATGREVRTFKPHAGPVVAVEYSPDGHSLISSGRDGVVRIWRLPDLHQLASIVMERGSGDWLVTSPDGFFDGTRAGWRLAPLRFPSQPLQMYVPEQFFNQFFQPGLLADVMREAKGMRDILRLRGDARASLDIARYRDSKLPEVRLDVATSASEREVRVTVSATDTGSGLRDLRVFRNQSLVHREHGALTPASGARVYRASVPVKLTAGRNEISAYVFNRDDIKGRDATLTLTGSPSLARRGTAYVIAVGVNEYANTAFNLRYAVADAQTVAKSLSRRFAAMGVAYGDIKVVELLNNQATKANILAALHKLGGRRTLLRSSTPPGLRTLQPAQPEDSVIMYFAGHGRAQGDRYYLIPHDLGYAGRPEAMTAPGTATMLDHSISDQDLESAFEQIDARNFMLIIDACQSGQALEAQESRRGPLNSRGLAQLAYEKGMYVLAASQSYQDALEYEKLGHGLLTYVLVEQGLRRMAADANRDGKLSAREWLDFPQQNLASEAAQAYARRIGRSGQRGVKALDASPAPSQAPRAYYRRETSQPWILAEQ